MASSSPDWCRNAILVGGGDKWVKSKTVRWTPPGLFKPFGNNNKNSSLKKNLELSVFTNMFLH